MEEMTVRSSSLSLELGSAQRHAEAVVTEPSLSWFKALHPPGDLRSGVGSVAPDLCNLGQSYKAAVHLVFLSFFPFFFCPL